MRRCDRTGASGGDYGHADRQDSAERADGFVDTALADCGSKRTAALLAMLGAATPWEKLAAPIRKLPECRYRWTGHPP